MKSPRLEISLILDKAAEEFALHGFEGMSMRVLADRLGVSAPALYHHFSSKEALYDEVCHHIFDNIAAAIDRALQGTRTPEERLQRFIGALFDEWDNRTLLVLTQRDVINASISPQRSFASTHSRLLFGMIRKILSQHFDGEIDEPLSFAFGSLFFGYCSLLVYFERESGLPTAEYRLRRKQELLTLSADLLRLRLSR